MAAPSSNAFATLRRLARPAPPRESCELCGTALASEHAHLLDLMSRRLACACEPCAILFSDRRTTRYRRVPRRVELLPDLRLTDAQWESLLLPINLAFFFHQSATGRVVALYPSPAGAMESLLSLESWRELVAENPVLGEMEPDVEALLVNRLGSKRDYYRVPIDECYRLVGLVRAHWRGLSGGTEVWAEVGRFFTALAQRAQGRSGHA
jgi:hypothetical protein